MLIVGLDPGLGCTGWGLIEAEGNRLRHVAHGVVRVAAAGSLAERLREGSEAPFARALAALCDYATTPSAAPDRLDASIAEIDQELESEPSRIRDGYEVRVSRFEPVGIVYLWPTSR